MKIIRNKGLGYLYRQSIEVMRILIEEYQYEVADVKDILHKGGCSAFSIMFV